MTDRIRGKRLFIAIDLLGNIKEAIYSVVSELFLNNRNVRRVAVQNIHLTLKFIGNVENDYVCPMKRAINTAVKGTRSFNFTINEHLNAFPNSHKASIIYLGINKGSVVINNIFNNIDESLGNIGIEREERKFIPHITLDRAKKKIDIGSLAEKKVFSDCLAAECSKITLFESRLKPRGAEYSIIEEFILNKPSNLN